MLAPRRAGGRCPRRVGASMAPGGARVAGHSHRAAAPLRGRAPGGGSSMRRAPCAPCPPWGGRGARHGGLERPGDGVRAVLAAQQLPGVLRAGRLQAARRRRLEPPRDAVALWRAEPAACRARAPPLGWQAGAAARGKGPGRVTSARAHAYAWRSAQCRPPARGMVGTRMRSREPQHFITRCAGDPAAHSFKTKVQQLARRPGAPHPRAARTGARGRCWPGSRHGTRARTGRR